MAAGIKAPKVNVVSKAAALQGAILPLHAEPQTTALRLRLHKTQPAPACASRPSGGLVLRSMGLLVRIAPETLCGRL